MVIYACLRTLATRLKYHITCLRCDIDFSWQISLIIARTLEIATFCNMSNIRQIWKCLCLNANALYWNLKRTWNGSRTLLQTRGRLCSDVCPGVSGCRQQLATIASTNYGQWKLYTSQLWPTGTTKWFTLRRVVFKDISFANCLELHPFVKVFRLCLWRNVILDFRIWFITATKMYERFHTMHLSKKIFTSRTAIAANTLVIS